MLAKLLLFASVPLLAVAAPMPAVVVVTVVDEVIQSAGVKVATVTVGQPKAKASPSSAAVDIAISQSVWGSASGPSIADIAQTTVPDCWLASAMVAIVNLNPAWIMARITQTESGVASFLVYDNGANPTSESITYDQAVDSANDDSNKDGAWWPAGWQKAIVAHGYSGETNGQLGAATGDVGLGLISGFAASLDYYDMTADDYWNNDIVKATSTPIVLCTKDSATTLVGGHCYAVFNYRTDGTTQYVTLHNPWGPQAEYTWTDVYADCSEIGHLTDYNSWSS